MHTSLYGKTIIIRDYNNSTCNLYNRYEIKLNVQ